MKGGDTPFVSCRPLYDIVHRSWSFLCHHLIDFVNVMWFYLLMTLFLWSLGTPFLLHLVTIQRRLMSLAALKLYLENKRRAQDQQQRQGSQHTNCRSSRTRQQRRDAPRKRELTPSSSQPENILPKRQL